jgi:MoaA/NifB/PqqE/SkfB family radical SAM enzyme
VETRVQPELDSFALGIHATPCTNRCRHCWMEGTPQHARVPAEQVFFVLEKLAELRDRFPQITFFLYDEPTNHPHFVDILEHAARLGLVGEDFFLATNGSILARAPDETWERMVQAGCHTLQLTAYGLEQAHDIFAGRQGAFQDLVTTIRRAGAHGVAWYAGVVIHQDNLSQVQEAVSYLRGLAPNGKASVNTFTFLWQGRGRDARRLCARDLAALPPERKPRTNALIEEREAVRRILDDPSLAARKASEITCGTLVWHVDRDLRVYCGGTCDSGGIAAATPDLRDAFLLGTLGDEGLLPLLESYRRARPRALRLLDQVTWGELAQRYGDRENDELYHLSDLPENKWAAVYLLEEFP